MNLDNMTVAELEGLGQEDPHVAGLEEAYDRAMGEAADAAADLRVDLDQKGPFFKYLKSCRQEAIEAIETITTIDPTNAPAVAKIQAAVLAYQSATGFALKLLEAYTPPESDSADMTGSGVGEPQ